MKKTLIVLLLCASGCKVSRFSYIKPDGTQIHASDKRLIFSTDAKINVELQSNGIPRISIEAKSSAQAEVLGAVAEGAAYGGARAARGH